MSRRDVTYEVTDVGNPHTVNVTVRSDAGIFTYTVSRRPIILVSEP